MSLCKGIWKRHKWLRGATLNHAYNCSRCGVGRNPDAAPPTKFDIAVKEAPEDGPEQPEPAPEA